MRVPGHVLMKGQTIRVRAVKELSSSGAEVGELFETRVATPVYTGGARAVPAGSLITGRVEGVRRAGSGGGPGVLDVRFVELRLPDGSLHKIEGRLTEPPKNAPADRAPDPLPDYDFKRKLVFRGGDAAQPGTQVVALEHAPKDTPRPRPDGLVGAFSVPASTYREATIRPRDEFWLVLKKDTTITASSR